MIYYPISLTQVNKESSKEDEASEGQGYEIVASIKDCNE